MTTYHHGALRRAVLDRALEIIATSGPERLSLRALAADLGVSHTAPRHHFGSRDGLLTAIATEGFDLLADALVATRESGAGFQEVGVAYVDFGVAHPAHFAVMFNPELLHDDPELDRASGRAFGELRDGVERLREGGQIDDAPAAVIAAWSLVHGLTTLALSGNLARAKLDGEPAGEPSLTGLARRAVAMLYGSAP